MHINFQIILFVHNANLFQSNIYVVDLKDACINFYRLNMHILIKIRYKNIFSYLMASASQDYLNYCSLTISLSRNPKDFYILSPTQNHMSIWHKLLFSLLFLFLLLDLFPPFTFIKNISSFWLLPHSLTVSFEHSYCLPILSIQMFIKTCFDIIFIPISPLIILEYHFLP